MTQQIRADGDRSAFVPTQERGDEETGCGNEQVRVAMRRLLILRERRTRESELMRK